MLKSLRFFAFISLIAGPLALLAQPITSTWVGATGSRWNVATNWSNNAVPDANTDVVFISAAGGTTLVNTNLGGAGTVMNLRSVTFNNHTALLGDGRIIGGSTAGELRFSTPGITIINLANTQNFTQTLSFNANANATMTLNLNYTGAATIDIGTGSQLALTGNGVVLTGTGGLIKEGAGTLRIGLNGSATLAAQGNYTGGFELRNGTVENQFSGSTTNNPFGSGPLTLSGGKLASNSATARTIYPNINLNGTVTLGDATNNGPLTFSVAAGQTTTLLRDSTLNVATGVAVTWNQTIAGAYKLTKTGAGTLYLQPDSNSTSSYSGGVAVEEGILQLGRGTSMGTGPVTLGRKDSGLDASIVSNLAGYGYSNPITVTSGAGALRLGSISTAAFSTSFSGTMAVNGALEVYNTLPTTNALRFTGVLSGSASINKTGPGEWRVENAANTYSGSIRLSEGRLRVDGTLGGSVTTLASTAFSGSGTIAGDVSISGIHTPGSSTTLSGFGIQTFGQNLTYNGGSAVTFEIGANSATQSTNTSAALFDQVIVGGALSFAGPTTLEIVFNTPTVITGTAPNTTTFPGSAVLWSDAFWSTNQSWKLYDAATVTNFSNLSLTTADWQDSAATLLSTARPGATFALSQSGNKVWLNYTAPKTAVDPYTAWRTQYFSTAELNDTAISGALADADGDGLNNFVEYALGLNPRQIDAVAVPATASSDGSWVFTYTRPTDRADVSYVVEASTDLQTWSTANVTHQQVSVVGATATWQALYSQSGAPKAFFRLKVTPAVP